MSERTVFIVSPVTKFDDDKQLWETYVGIKNEEMTLRFSCWDAIEEKSRGLAESLADTLNTMGEIKNKQK